MQKLVDGELVDLTEQEVADRIEEETLALDGYEERMRASFAFVVNSERDRRTEHLFVFGGKSFQLDATSQRHITAKGAQAKFAILSGAAVDDLRWADPDQDFGWIATDNAITLMDAHTMAAFADAADRWVSLHIMAGRAVKETEPHPIDVTADVLWPA